MEGKDWWIIIGLVIVVAVIASLVTVKFTGNVVNVPISSATVGVYTKAEVDSIITNLTTVQKVLNALSMGNAYSLDGICKYSGNTTICSNDSVFGTIQLNNYGQTTASYLCAKLGKTCTMAMIRYGTNTGATDISSCNLGNDPVTLRFICS